MFNISLTSQFQLGGKRIMQITLTNFCKKLHSNQFSLCTYERCVETKQYLFRHGLP